MQNNKELVNYIRMRSNNYLDSISRSQRILDAFYQVDRIDFLPNASKELAYIDSPVSIGFGQTCSQPSMVAFMLDKLEIEKGNRILEIGSGCGYSAVIAYFLSQPKGIVYATEIKEELFPLLKKNCSPYKAIKIFAKDGSTGLKKYAPFDRIFISAGVTGSSFQEEILLEQLTDNGILLYPENYGNMYKIKKEGNKYKRTTFYGVSFVPLKGENS